MRLGDQLLWGGCAYATVGTLKSRRASLRISWIEPMSPNWSYSTKGQSLDGKRAARSGGASCLIGHTDVLAVPAACSGYFLSSFCC